MLVVRVDEPMRVAPGGHVIDLKLGETADGSLAEYLVATGCNVTVLSEPEAEAEAGPEADGGSDDTEQGGGGDLTAALTATADVANEVPADMEVEPEGAEAAPVKPAKAGKTTTK